MTHLAILDDVPRFSPKITGISAQGNVTHGEQTEFQRSLCCYPNGLPRKSACLHPLRFVWGILLLLASTLTAWRLLRNSLLALLGREWCWHSSYFLDGRIWFWILSYTKRGPTYAGYTLGVCNWRKAWAAKEPHLVHRTEGSHTIHRWGQCSEEVQYWGMPRWPCACSCE